MNELNIIKRGDAAYIDSREVAEYIGKKHQHLLRDIRGYIAVIEKFGGASKIGRADFFLKSSYLSEQNQEKPCFLLTKMGCELVANKLIGEKGVLFTAAYVTKYNEMERRERAEIEKKAATPRLRVFNTAVRNVLSGFSYTHANAGRVYDFLGGAYKPFGIEVTPYSWHENTLTITDIARILEVYSLNGRPHGHAVAAIIDRLDVEPEDIEISPYGLIGISVRYATRVLMQVGDWLVANDFPDEIPHLYFAYHVRYDRQTSLFDDEDYETRGFGDDYDADERFVCAE